MTAPTTYTELQAEVKDHLHRADLDSKIPSFIQMGEARLNRRLRARSMIATININPSQVNTYDSLPAGFMELISFSDDLGDELQQVSYEELEDLAYGSSADRPRYFSLGARIDWPRVAGSSYSYPMRYWKRLDIVTDSSNDVLTYNPDAYVYSALLAAQPYLKDDSRMVVWGEMLSTTIKEINRRERRSVSKLRGDIGSNRGFNILRGW